MAGLNDRLQKSEATYVSMKCGRDKLNNGEQFAVLSKEMIENYIDKIVVGDEQHIEIHWKEKVREEVVC